MTVLLPPSSIYLCQPPPWWHYIIPGVTVTLPLASALQSQQPIVFDADQTSKDAMLR